MMKFLQRWLKDRMDKKNGETCVSPSIAIVGLGCYLGLVSLIASSFFCCSGVRIELICDL